MILYSITKSVSIDAPPARVFEFLADPANWPKWAIVNVKSIKPAADEWWEMETPAGKARLRIRPDAATWHAGSRLPCAGRKLDCSCAGCCERDRQ